MNVTGLVPNLCEYAACKKCSRNLRSRFQFVRVRTRGINTFSFEQEHIHFTSWKPQWWWYRVSARWNGCGYGFHQWKIGRDREIRRQHSRARSVGVEANTVTWFTFYQRRLQRRCHNLNGNVKHCDDTTFCIIVFKTLKKTISKVWNQVYRRIHCCYWNVRSYPKLGQLPTTKKWSIPH